jgi:hypothetical protein
MASALVVILADTFRLRFRISRQKKVKSIFPVQTNKSTDGVLQPRNNINPVIINLAFRLPSSENWLYLSISRNGKSSKINFGFSSIEPSRSHLC